MRRDERDGSESGERREDVGESEGGDEGGEEEEDDF